MQVVVGSGVQPRRMLSERRERRNVRHVPALAQAPERRIESFNARTDVVISNGRRPDHERRYAGGLQAKAQRCYGPRQLNVVVGVRNSCRHHNAVVVATREAAGCLERHSNGNLFGGFAADTKWICGEVDAG